MKKMTCGIVPHPIGEKRAFFEHTPQPLKIEYRKHIIEELDAGERPVSGCCENSQLSSFDWHTDLLSRSCSTESIFPD